MQIPLEFPHPETDGIIDGKANEAARQAIAQPNWPNGILLINGAKGAGKTTLARQFFPDAAWLKTVEAIDAFLQEGEPELAVLDELGEVLHGGGETAIFHLFNHARNSNGIPRLLILSDHPPATLSIELPDLKSRIASISQIGIDPPDDVLAASLIARGFHTRGVVVDPAVINYMLRRMERSYEVIEEAIQKLDQAARAKGGKISLPLVKLYFEGQL